MTDEHQAKMDEVNAECEKVQGFFESLPEDLRADAAERFIYVIALWGSRDHYQALGILAEALLSYREASISALREEQDDEPVSETQTPPATSGEPATGMAIFDEDGNPVTDGEAGFRPLTGVCRVCGYGCCVHFSGEIKASTIECPVCHKDGPETQTPP